MMDLLVPKRRLQHTSINPLFPWIAISLSIMFTVSCENSILFIPSQFESIRTWTEPTRTGSGSIPHSPGHKYLHSSTFPSQPSTDSKKSPVASIDAVDGSDSYGDFSEPECVVRESCF